MARKLIIPILLIAMLILVSSVSAHPTDGCYATVSASTINEDESVTVTIQCDNIPTTNNVFGYQFSTTRVGDFDPTTAPTTYTEGTFSNVSTGATSGVIVGKNILSGLYAVTRQASEIVDQTAFTLGSYALTAENDLIADGAINITFTDGDFILSNNLGESLSGWLRDTNDIDVTVTNIDLGWFSGDMIVRSDVTAITNVGSIDLVLGDNTTYSATNVAGYTNTFNMDDTYRYFEAGTPAGNGILQINVSADMTGHLVCSNTIDLGDTGSVTDVDTKIGVTGTITLKAGDADNDGDIDNTDATAIGANLGTPGGEEQDINGDGTVNILDLVHVGRNYNATSTTCGTGS